MNIKELKSDYKIALHKVNREVVAELHTELLESYSVDLIDINTIELTIPKYVSDKINMSKVRYYAYDLVKEERLISLDEEKFFVIKKISENKRNGYKKISAYSLEYKMAKNDIKVEDIGFYLRGKDEDGDIYSLDEYMYQEIGWNLGHIDDVVQFETLEDGTKQEKLRWQESISTNWYDFLTNNVKEGWDCVVDFDTKNKLVNLYHIDSFGDKLSIVLSYDNYMKDLEKTTSTEDLATRLEIIGNENVSVLEVNPTGYPYVEDYSYFIQNEEMSIELINALNKYNEMVKKRTIIWKSLLEQRNIKRKELNSVQIESYKNYADLTAKESILQGLKLSQASETEINKVIAEITKLRDEKVIFENKIQDLENEIELLQNQIDEIVLLCKREGCTDDEGNLVFNDTLLNELKDYVYNDTYTNDCFLNAQDLFDAGERELGFRCKPTREWDIDSVNFMNRIIDNGFRSHFKGNIGLGDVIALYDKDTNSEELVYFVGFVQNFKTKELTLSLCDKKIKNDNRKDIGDLLYKAKRAERDISSNRYLWINQKKNRLNPNSENNKRGW
ncbi:MAG: hypothetical protein ACRC7S_18695 [Cetobacterium sp.]